MPIHVMLAMELPAKIIKAINKILRGFLWCGKAEANGGNCSVAWPVVCAPKWAGGLGIPDLKWMNIAMQARWQWLAQTDNSRPWSEFTISLPKAARQLCNAAMHKTVRDGRQALFWEDRWLEGFRIGEVAPAIYSRIPKAITGNSTSTRH